MGDRWNHNIEYHRVILDALRGGAPGRVLDVGCGEGLLLGDLTAVAERVVGIELHEPSLDRARSEFGGAAVELVLGDVMTHPFEPGSFDAVVSVAVIHHLDEAAALARFAELVRPGGTVAVIALARADLPRDLPHELAGAVLTRVLKRRHGGYWEPDTPKAWPPPSTYRQLAATAAEVLPGVVYRRLALWRCSLVWTKPTDGT